MFKKMILIAAIALLSISAQIGTASANLATNGGFETGTFEGWTVDTVNNWAMVLNSGTQYAGNYEAQLGTYGTAGTLSQTLTTSANQQYIVNFWLANDMKDATNMFQVLWNGQVQSLNPVLNPTLVSPYTQYHFTTNGGNGSSTIAFNFLNDPSVYHLDNVAVTATPIPAAAWLFGSGLMGLAGMRRKMQNNS